MNREQRRKFAKFAGLDQDSAALIAEVFEKRKKYMDELALKEGDLVAVDVDKIEGREDYPSFNEKYKEFVHSSRGKRFTVVKEEKFADKPLVSFEEDENDPKLLFWEGDLIKFEK